jgi:hypothetical protein
MTKRIAAMAGACVLLLGACARQQQASSGGGGGGPSITIQSPQDGAQVSSPVEVRVEVDGAEIGPPETGAMHLHVYLGDTGDYEVVTSTTAEVPLPQGEQTLRIVLAEPNHDETDVSAEVTVDVTSGSATGDGTGGGGYGYTRYGGGDEGS